MSPDPFTPENQKDIDISSMDPKVLNELQFMLKDALAGDPTILDQLDLVENLNIEQVKAALDFILNNPDLTDTQRGDLLSNSWRLNYKDRPPTPEEFLTEKYLGPVATTIFPQVRKSFLEFLDPTQPYRTLVLYPFIGFGKLLAYDEVIYTPRGKVKVDEIAVGDSVCTPNGNIAKVIDKTDYPDETLYRITFSDGRSVVAGGPHYWKAAKSKNGIIWSEQQQKCVKMKSEPCWKIITTEEIIKDIKQNPKSRWFIPFTQPVYHIERNHIIPPYTLGALLGDGSITKTLRLVGDDVEIHDRVIAELPKTMKAVVRESKSCYYSTVFLDSAKSSVTNIYVRELQRLGLRETTSATKFVPDEYLYDSIDNRISLLQGLMDTDGTAHIASGMAIFCTTSPKLRDAVIEIVQGLGGRASYTTRHAEQCTNANFDQYSVSISFPSNTFPIFHLERKQKRIDAGFARERKRAKKQHLYIQSIEELDKKGGACIAIDDEDKLFLTTGYVVTHNSYTAILLNLYINAHMSMMRAPWRFFGQSPATIYTTVYCATSLKKSSELLLEPMLNMLESSPFFEKVHTKEGMAQRERDFTRMNNIDRIFWTTAVPTSEIQFSNGANVKLISSPNGLLGQTIVCGTMTELSFFYDAGWSNEKIFKFFSKLRGRIESRMKGNYFGRFILDSSPNTMESVIDDWIVNEAPKNPTNYIVKGSRWRWVPSDFAPNTFDEAGNVRLDKSFPVFIGGKGRPPTIIEPETRHLYDITDIIDVPDTLIGGSMRGIFEENLFEALKDQAGIPAGSSDKIFYETAKIEKVFDPRLKSVYTHIVASSKDSPEGIIWNQIKDLFFVKYVNSYQFWYKPHIPRVFAIDQSITGDVTAIVIAHVEREKRAPTSLNAASQYSTVYIIDLIVPITPKGGRINLDAIRYFIEDLRDKGGMNLIKGSFDQFQSEATMQYLIRRGFEIEKLSVDKEMDAYLNFVSIIESGRLRAGRSLHLKNNLKSLQIVRRKDSEGKRTGSQKVDHVNGELVLDGNITWETSLIGTNAKDVADAACACCELLRKHDVLPYEEWEPDLIKEPNREDAQKTVQALLAKNKWTI